MNGYKIRIRLRDVHRQRNPGSRSVRLALLDTNIADHDFELNAPRFHCSISGRSRFMRRALSVLADRQLVASFRIVPFIVEELLQQIDLDYYRSVRLLIVHAELEQLRQDCPTSGDRERRRGPRIDVGRKT